MTKALEVLEDLGVTVREATEDDDEFGVIVPGKWYWFEDGNWCGPFATADAATDDALGKFAHAQA